VFFDFHKLILHMGSHTEPTKCGYPGCGAIFWTKDSLAIHMHVMHSPRPEGISRKKAEEQRVALALKAAGIPFKRELHSVHLDSNGGTSWKFVDFVMQLNGHVVMLEVDEKQHKASRYSSDAVRMTKVVDALRSGGCAPVLPLTCRDLPVTFVRYNPHSYWMGFGEGRVRMQTRGRVEREAKLVELLRQTGGPFYTNQPLSIVYMYYDTNADGTLSVIGSHEFPFALRGCVATI
jgi:hypothetical protein